MPDIPNPILAEATRGPLVESVHRGAVAVVDRTGALSLAVGNIDRIVFARSAIKPIQAIPLLETGAANRFAVTDSEVALACASHSGEPVHVGLVRDWLHRIGCDAHDLACGGHAPIDAAAARSLVAAGHEPGPEHNNCSGKHTGFLTLARHLEVSVEDYASTMHPVQAAVRAALGDLCDSALADAPVGIDGCGAPQYGIALRAIARGMARIAAPDDLAPARRAAVLRIRAAMLAAPHLVSGTGRFCGRLMAALGGRVVVKVGAEGVYTAAIPAASLGVALKIDDGATRAAEVVLGAVLVRLGVITPDEAAALEDLLVPRVPNVMGRPVGVIRAVPGALA